MNAVAVRAAAVLIAVVSLGGDRHDRPKMVPVAGPNADYRPVARVNDGRACGRQPDKEYRGGNKRKDKIGHRCLLVVEHDRKCDQQDGHDGEYQKSLTSE